ncbi:MAG: hypothetical protein KGI33_01685 [Thaumarchaeota archaeon]|nr:hypothetical protein [Nitrososphaerota archaeon]
MAKLYLKRGLVIVAIGIAILVLGSKIFDYSYNNVGSVMVDKHYLIDHKQMAGGQSLNSTITWDQLAEHSVILVNSLPSSAPIKLQVEEPGHQTFDKESSDGYLYHIIGKSPQNQGSYNLTVSNSGSDSAYVTVIFGEDPYLSGKCTASDEVSCYAIPAAIGIVIAGMLALIVGASIAILDFRKKR